MRDINDETRETMFFASINNRLVKAREVKSIVYDNYSLEEFKKIMIEKSPVSLYHSMYSKKQPAYHITKRIMPSDGGAWIYANSAADKTPRLTSWESLYNELRIQGLEYITF